MPNNDLNLCRLERDRRRVLRLIGNFRGFILAGGVLCIRLSRLAGFDLVRRVRHALGRLDLDVSSGDEQPVQDKTASGVHHHIQKIGLISFVIEQPDDRACACRSADLEAVLSRNFKFHRIVVDLTLGQLDDCAFRHFLFPIAEPRAQLARRRVKNLRRCLLRYRAPIFAATDVRAEAVIIRHPNAFLRRLFRRKNNPPAFRIHRDMIIGGLMVPVLQVRGDNCAVWHKPVFVRAEPARCADRHTFFAAVHTVEIAIIILRRFSSAEPPILNDRALKRSKANRRRHIQFSGNVRRFDFGLWTREKLRVVGQHAESETIFSRLFDARGRCIAHSIRSQPPDKQAYLRDVEACRIPMRIDPTDVCVVRDAVKRSADEVERRHLAHIHSASAPQLQLIDRLRYAEQSIKLNRARRPSRDIPGYFFE